MPLLPRAALTVALLLLACATAATSSSAPTAPASPAPQQGGPSRYADIPCPSSFASATGACTKDGVIPNTCNYPEGRCRCMAPSVCSGVPRPPPPPSEYRWECQAGKLRPDGCPWDEPSQGSACGTLRTCSYATCGGPIFECVDGRWKLGQMVSPPG